MVEYRQIGVIDEGLATELHFYFEINQVAVHPATKKVVVGKRIVEKPIQVPTVNDTDLQISIFLFGPNNGNINGKTLVQEEDALFALNDSATHTLTVGKHSGTYYLMPQSFSEDNEFNRNHPTTLKYDVLFLQKNI